MQVKKANIANWNNIPAVDANLILAENEDEILKVAEKSEGVIARGAGRSYGDASLYKNICQLSSPKKLLVFNTEDETVTCSSDVTLDEIIRRTLPHGYNLPVLPGTKHITLGGAIAADVHGKNHSKEGSFGNSVLEIKLITDGKVVSCTPKTNSEYFWNTIGGQGLTGIITEAKLSVNRVSSANVVVSQTKFEQTKNLLKAFENSESEFKIAWFGNKTNTGYHIVFTEADYATDNVFELPDESALRIPFPLKLVNKFSIKIYNAKRFANVKPGKTTMPFHHFMFPLDTMENWNVAYGKKGFMQYQCCIAKGSEKSIDTLLDQAYNSGHNPFLTVLKKFGNPKTKLSPLSFPKEGYTMSLDFAYHKNLNSLFAEMDKVVVTSGGRIYLAKDCRLSADAFYKMYPKAMEFKEFIASKNNGKFKSLLAERLKLVP